MKILTEMMGLQIIETFPVYLLEYLSQFKFFFRSISLQSNDKTLDGLRGYLELVCEGVHPHISSRCQKFEIDGSNRDHELKISTEGPTNDFLNCKFSVTITLTDIKSQDISDALQPHGANDSAEADSAHETSGRSLIQEIRALNLTEEADAWLQGSDGPDRKVPCLRFVLGIRSPTFAAMFSTEGAQEATSGVVIIKEYDSSTLKSFWNFLLKDDTTGWREGKGQLAIHMLSLGDCYLVKRLKTVAAETLSEIVSDLNATAILVAADLHSIGTLEELALCHIGTSRNFKATEIEKLPQHLRIKVVDRLLRGNE